MSLVIDYSRYQTLRITRRGANQTVLDIQMKAGGPGGNGKLPTAGHEGTGNWLKFGAMFHAMTACALRCCVVRVWVFLAVVIWRW